MAYSKNFPRTVEGSNYPRWEEVYLTVEEEQQEEEKSRQAVRKHNFYNFL